MGGIKHKCSAHAGPTSRVFYFFLFCFFRAAQLAQLFFFCSKRVSPRGEISVSKGFAGCKQNSFWCQEALFRQKNVLNVTSIGHNLLQGAPLGRKKHSCWGKMGHNSFFVQAYLPPSDIKSGLRWVDWAWGVHFLRYTAVIYCYGY